MWSIWTNLQVHPFYPEAPGTSSEAQNNKKYHFIEVGEFLRVDLKFLLVLLQEKKNEIWINETWKQSSGVNETQVVSKYIYNGARDIKFII